MQLETAELVEALRKTLHDIQDTVRHDSAAIQNMKRAILRAIAELEADLKGHEARREEAV
jgi:hypothetical protein